MKNMFTISEIITIVMEEVTSLKEKEIYSIENEEYDLPKPILGKIESLDQSEFNEFRKKIGIIADKILEFQSGELNQLNTSHEEISLLVKEIFDETWIN